MQQILASIISLVFLYVYMSTQLQYQHQQQVIAIITYMNQYIASRHFQQPLHEDDLNNYNSLLIHPQNDYCSNSDMFKYYHQDIVLQDTYFIRDVPSFIRDVLRNTYYDVMPYLPLHKMNTHLPNQYYLPLQLTIPYNHHDQLTSKFQIGYQSLCIFQKNNHYPLKQSKHIKDNTYIQHMIDHNVTQDCLMNATHIPQVYHLNNQTECQAFFNLTHTGNTPRYISKQLGIDGRHTANVLFSKQMLALQNKYKQGTKCGFINDVLKVQQYIHNPYLINGFKMQFRVYFIVASTLPLIVYVHDVIAIRHCKLQYNINQTDKSVHLCNLLSQQEVYLNMTLSDIQEELFNEGRIKNPKWLSKQIMPKIYRSIIIAAKGVEFKLTKDSKFSELFSADFIMSDDLEIHMISHQFNPPILREIPNHEQLLKDIIDVENAYNRSKYLRIKKLINRVIKKMNKLEQSVGQAFNKNITQKLKYAYMDRLDEGIDLKIDNQFRKVIDSYQNGTKRYSELLQLKCII